MNSKKFSRIVLLVALSFAGASLATEVRTANGVLVGDAQDDIYRFLGVPYAAPPLGDSRWRAPQAAVSWTGKRSATDYGANCMQVPYPESLPYYRAMPDVSEDCLYLNIWSKALTGKRPVMVWLHGGSLARGSGSSPFYDGTEFARRGIVLVTINYRLNVFGYFSHPELSAEQGGHSGNYGTLDQIQALRWIKDNINEFGGDPDNVTVVGQSAGAWSVSHLMSSPLAAGLFHKSIGQSGASMTAIPVLKGAEGAEVRSGEALQKLTGVDGLAALRSLDADVLLKTFASHPGLELGAIVDGQVIPEQPQTLFREGRFNRVDTLLGFNEDESSAFAPYIGVPSSAEEWRASAEHNFGAAALDYLQTYRDIACEEGVASAYLAGWRDLEFGWPMRYWARASESFGNAAFFYYFSRQPPDSWGQSLGAYHAAEISYLFANDVAENDIDQTLSRTMQAYWSNFARSGDPNGEGLPVWPRFGTAESYLELGDSIEAGVAIHDRQLDFWDKILARSQEDKR